MSNLPLGTYEILVDGMNTGRKINLEIGTNPCETLEYFSVSYELNEGTMTASADKYLKGVGLKLNKPERTGYAFAGWYLNRDFSGGEITEIDGLMEESCQLYAKWTKKEAEVVPDEPVLPEEPTNPEEPVLPEEPVEPVVPDQPVEPEKPVAPDQPVMPEESGPTTIINVIEQVIENVVAPKTGDAAPIVVDVALIGGAACIMRYFTDRWRDDGMTENEKQEMLWKLIQGTRKKNILIRLSAVAVLFFELVYYYTIGMSEETRELRRQQYKMGK